MTSNDETPETEPASDASSEKSDPRLHEPEGDEGIPGTLIDTPQNMPGDQPVDDTPPSRTKATGDD